MKKLLCLFAFAFNVAIATQTIAVLPSDGTLSDDENELLTDKMREAALKVLPVNQFTLLKQDVVIKRLGGMENYIKECSETSCIVSLGKKAQVDYVAQCKVGKLGNRLRITVELYEVSMGGLLGMFNEIVEDFDKLPPLMDRKAPDVFNKIIAMQKPIDTVNPPPVPVAPSPTKKPSKIMNPTISVSKTPEIAENPPPAPVAPPVKDDTENRMSWSGKTSDLEEAVDVELGYKEPKEKIDPKVNAEKEGNNSFWTALVLDIAGVVLIYYGYTRDKEAVNTYENYVSMNRHAQRSQFEESWLEVEDNKNKRNLAFVLGGIFMAAGIGVHIWF